MEHLRLRPQFELWLLCSADVEEGGDESEGECRWRWQSWIAVFDAGAQGYGRSADGVDYG
jgi:hypothetical protein